MARKQKKPLLTLDRLQEEVRECRECSRLVKWREKVAQEKRAAYAEEEYWGRPVPSFGDPAARLILCGLAPAAHGANRTGRVFTGDRSGEWLFGALYRAGYANQAESSSKTDGLVLTDCYITMCVRCAPPENKPTTQERDRCLGYLSRELPLLPNSKVLLCLGAFAWNGVLKALRALGKTCRPVPKFGHGSEAIVGEHTLLGSYHPSQQNTFTGRLTESMLDQIFDRARAMMN